MARKTLQAVIANDFGSINGGAARVAVSSALGLADAGVRVFFFCAVGPVDQRLEAHPNIKVSCLGQQDILNDPNRLRAAVKGLWNKAAARSFRTFTKALDPASTAVHVHCFTKAMTASVLDQAARAGFPLALTLHDYFPACPTGGFFNYQKSEICPLRPMSAACVFTNCDSRSPAHKAWRVLRQMDQNRAVARMGQIHYIYLSRTSRDLLRGRLPGNAVFHHLDNPVHAAKAPRVDAAMNRDILFVGRLEKHKGAALLARTCRETGTKAVFCGEGPLRDEIEKDFEVTGWLDSAVLGKRLDAARAVVFPSLWPEGQPLVPLEALARGLPVAVSGQSAARECVEHGVNGLVFNPLDKAQFRAVLKRLGQEKPVRGMSEAAYRLYWNDPPTLERHVAGLVEIYEEMTADKG